jgi:excisionase family DNA binding protein
MNDRLACSVSDAANSIGVHPNTIYNWISEGRLVSVKVGRRRLIRMDSLRELIGTSA